MLQQKRLLMARWRFVMRSCSVFARFDLRHCSTAITESDSGETSKIAADAGTATPAAIGSRNLALALDLSKADFGKIVKATKAAVARERRWKDAAVWEVFAARDVPLAAEAAEPVKRCGDGNADNAPPVTNGSAVCRADSFEAKDVRYSLMDTLRDCLLAGNWAKAMRIFETAVDNSRNMRQQLFPSLVSTATTSTTTVEEKEKEEEEGFLEALRRINATTPPGMLFSGKTKQCGILRWGGGHFYLLLKLLLSRHRVVEAERVWYVMKRIGFLEFHLDTLTLNRCITLAARPASSNITIPLTNSNKHIDDKMKSFQKVLLAELEEWAKKRQLALNERNKHVTRAANLAEKIGKEEWENENSKDVNSLDGQGLKVGDFSGLLRRCNSEEATARVLKMMDKLGIYRDCHIYSALICALRQPQYCLTDDKKVESEKNTKEEYDAHRRRRCERARRWFLECPESERTADVYNEILQITRGGEEENEEFERLIVEFRGGIPLPLMNSSRSTDNCEVVEKNMTLKGAENEGTKNSLEAKPTPPRWRTLPNGRTYEIMISYCKYLREWSALWRLYDEMMEQRVKGTRRLYEMLLEVVARNPPFGRESHAVVMELHEDMRRSGVNLTGLNSTVTVVNAWCATRRRKRW